MMKWILLFFFMFTSTLVLAHKAHVHGEGTLGLAFDGTRGTLILEVPAEALMGFEHQPKKTADIKKRDEAFKKLENKISEMVIFPNEIKCVFAKQKIALNLHDGHGEVSAEFNIECASSPKGKTVEFSLKSVFAGIKRLSADILVDDLQKNVEITEAGAKVGLK